MRLFFTNILLILIFSACHAPLYRNVSSSPLPRSKDVKPNVLLGIENFLMNYKHLVKNKKVGLLTNPSGVDSRLNSTADLLANDKDVQLTALFGPEHGIRGAIYAGETVEDEVDPQTGVPVFSLYGKYRKPTPEMLKNVDVILVDIQDIGLRGYTYIYSMAKVMEAAAENGKQVIVLDRPNPIGGVKVEGNLVEKGFESFVGLYPIPYRYGMTIGELAKLFNEEFGIHCQLTVIPMKGWTREMYWNDTGLLWVPTSPHVPHWETVLYQIATGTFGELRVLSEGVGYTSPFELVGAPWIDGYRLAKALNDLNLHGVLFRPLYFKPYYAAYKGQICQGVQLHITDFRAFNAYETGLHILRTVMDLYPQQDILRNNPRLPVFNKVMGCAWIAEDLMAGKSVAQISQKWQKELKSFLKIRKKYLLY